MSSQKANAPKPPINRKLAVYVVGTLGVLVLLAVALMMAHSNPEAKRQALLKAQEQKALASLPHGTSSGAETLLSQHAGPVGDTASLYKAPIVQSDESKPAQASTAGVPSVDHTTLAQLEAAYSASGHKPAIGGHLGSEGGGGKTGVAGLNSFGGDTSSPATGVDGVYQDYPKEQSDIHTVAAAAGLAPQNATASSGPKTYAAAEPMKAPADRILTTGTLIRAVLTDKIDTHNAGKALATVTQNVYDSLDASILLIPAGSKLVGTYQTTVQPGLPRIPVTFSTLYLPDGRMVDLSRTQAVDYSGATGVPGKYHSNILRALGPSLVVALVGTAIDRYGNKNQNEQSGFGMQSPSVAEQMAPQVNNEVMQRYQGAQPYFIVKAGTPFKIVLDQNIVIPAASDASHPAVTGRPSAAPVPVPPGAGVWQASGDNQ